MPDPYQQPQPKKDGVPLIAKILILVAIGFIAWVLISGIQLSLDDIFMGTLKVGFAFLLLYFVYYMFIQIFKPKPFSPTDSFQKKLIRIAEQSKPENIKTLALRGEDMRFFSKLGKVSGLLFIPYLSSVPEKDVNGEFVYELKKNKFGVIEKDEFDKPIKIKKMKVMDEKNGDWLFIIKKNFLSERLLVRAHHSFVSPISETVWIKDVNVVPVGAFYYPAKQFQSEIIRIQAQHQAEAVIETHSHFLDLVANITETTLSGDPNYLRIMMLNNENISTQGGVVGGNR